MAEGICQNRGGKVMIKSVKHMENNKRAGYVSLLLIYGVLTFFSPYTVEAGNYPSDNSPNKIKVLRYSPTRLRISSKGINRISFAGERLDKIIGNQSSYSAVIADQGDHLFLTSKKGPGSKIALSLLFTSGKVVDLVMQVDKGAQSYSMLIFPVADESAQEISAAEEMQRAMQGKKIGKYYVQYLNRELLVSPAFNSRIIQTKSYRYGSLYGAVLLLENSSNETSYVDESVIRRQFNDVISVALDKTIIPAKQSIKAYVVFRGGKDE